MAETETRTEFPPIIQQHLDEIVALARSCGVERLEVFGSVMTDRYDPDRSDVDFLVRFTPRGALDDFRRYVEMESELARVLNAPSDLILPGALKRETFRQEANKTRKVIYDARWNA